MIPFSKQLPFTFNLVFNLNTTSEKQQRTFLRTKNYHYYPPLQYSYVQIHSELKMVLVTVIHISYGDFLLVYRY